MMLDNKSYLIIFFFLIVMNSLEAQTVNDNEAILESLFSRRMTVDDDEKKRLNDSIILILHDYVHSDSVFQHKYDNLRFLGQITSSDNTLKIVTWNMMLSSGLNYYYCYIIRKNGNHKPCTVYRLFGRNRRDPVLTDTVYDSGNWYGALYYAVQPFRHKGSKDVCYVLLGYDFGKMSLSRKIIDFLSFDEQGDILFGLPCLFDGKTLKNREILEYSATGTISLRFTSRKSIVFDHLAPVQDDDSNAAEYGSAMSFDAYILKNGIWNMVENVDVRNMQ